MLYSRTPEIETTDLSQFHVSLNFGLIIYKPEIETARRVSLRSYLLLLDALIYCCQTLLFTAARRSYLLLLDALIYCCQTLLFTAARRSYLLLLDALICCCQTLLFTAARRSYLLLLNALIYCCQTLLFTAARRSYLLLRPASQRSSAVTANKQLLLFL